ncbi:MAG: transglutaminase domain-containing protein [Bacteroidota bacterium]|nr:transglutaminase domain-containing protein [Bacteroidota bacterium]
MKIIILGLIVLFCTSCKMSKSNNNQSAAAFDSIASQKNIEIQKLWGKKDFKQAIALMNDFYASFLDLEGSQKAKYAENIPFFFYKLSCGYSLLKQNDSAIKYLQKAVDCGYSDYYSALKDSDLNNIRGNEKYLTIIKQLKKVVDYEETLKRYPTYHNESIVLPKYTYQSNADIELKNLRRKYKLDSVAGKGDEISRMINLMEWVHKTVRHDGHSQNPTDTHADAIIQLCAKEKRGVNCRMLATILNEVYLAMGFKSHFVTCLPKKKDDPDCHVINCVFSKKLNKWIWMDPTFDTWVKDEKGNLLSIEEVRERLISGLPVKASPSINWNGNPNDGNNYLHNYMAKNLFQFEIPLNSCAAYESLNSKNHDSKSNEPLMLTKSDQNERAYIHLTSVEYKSENIKPQNHIYYTNDSKQFWIKPE